MAARHPSARTLATLLASPRVGPTTCSRITLASASRARQNRLAPTAASASACHSAVPAASAPAPRPLPRPAEVRSPITRSYSPHTPHPPPPPPPRPSAHPP